jgi:hypothetical protein
MSLSHRSEVLDAHMGDNNWKKLIGLVPAITKKFKRAKIERDKFQDEYEDMNKKLSKELLHDWTQIALKCEEERKDNILAMDAYDIQLPDIRTRADIHADLITKEPPNYRGITSWIATGVKLEEEK